MQSINTTKPLTTRQHPMPRSSAKALLKADFLNLVDDAYRILAIESLDTESSDEDMEDSEDSEDSDGWQLIEDLVDMYSIVFEPRYMASRQISAGRHADNIMTNLIDSFSDLGTLC